MKDIFKKYKKWILLLFLFLIFIAVGVSVFIFFFKQDEEGVQNNNIDIENNSKVQELPDYDERSSTEVVLATYEQAKLWSTDVQLYDCSGLTSSSVKYSDTTYYFVGADSGKYYRWSCTYYSKILKQTKVFLYVEGEVDSSNEAVDIGAYADLGYNDIAYPSLDDLVDSTQIYQYAKENGLDEDMNYVNMYLTNTRDYGFVWRLDERSKEMKDEYGTGVVVNTYIFDIYTGELKIKLPGSIY